jgi:hypothetical protein
MGLATWRVGRKMDNLVLWATVIVLHIDCQSSSQRFSSAPQVIGFCTRLSGFLISRRCSPFRPARRLLPHSLFPGFATSCTCGQSQSQQEPAELVLFLHRIKGSIWCLAVNESETEQPKLCAGDGWGKEPLCAMQRSVLFLSGFPQGKTQAKQGPPHHTQLHADHVDRKTRQM